MNEGAKNDEWKQWSQHVLIEIKRLNDGQVEMAKNIASIDKTLAGQHVQLVEHIRRTGLLEDAMEPIKKHVAMISGGLKVVGVVGAVLGVIASLKAFFVG